MRKKINKTQMARDFMAKNPNARAGELAKQLKCGMSYAYTVMSKLKAESRAKAKAGKLVFTYAPKAVEDKVNHPSHYKAGGIETIDFIEAKKLNYHLGNVVKYITRSELKGNKLEDLKKAQWYLKREISNLEK